MKKITALVFLCFAAFAGEQRESFIDMKNHLEWQDNVKVEDEEKWAMSQSYCHTLKLLGHNDWRLPTIEELKTVIDIEQTPKPNRRFHYGATGGYWTSQEDKNDDVNAWAIYMQTGHLFSNDKCDSINRRCVRTRFNK